MMTQLLAEVAAGGDPMVSGKVVIGIIGALCTGAALWQRIRSAESLQAAITAADNATLIAVDDYLATQHADGLIWFAIGSIQNEMIRRFKSNERKTHV